MFNLVRTLWADCFISDREAQDHSAVVVGWIGKPPARCRLASAT